MTNRRTATLVLALLVGALAAFMAYFYVNGAQERALHGATLVPSLVVREEIAIGSSAEAALKAGGVKTADMPQKFRPATAVVDPAGLKGKVAVTTLHPGQVVVEGMFVDPAVAQVTSANRIPAGQVGVTFQFDAVHGVAGLIEPGDKVNIMTSTPDGGQRTLFQNVDVLFIGARAAPAPGATTASTVAPVDTSGGSLITFAVPQVAAERLALAARQDAGLYLTLVPPDNASAAVPPVNAGSLFNGGVTPYEG